MSGLRDLDARVVPAVARAVRTASARTRSALAAATGVPALRRLDRRFASSGPLGFVREVPQVGVLVVAAVFVTGALSAASLQDRRAPVARAVADDGPLVLGPAPGQDVARWSANARSRVVTTAAARPGARYLALVSYTAYRPVADAAGLGPGVVVQRAYLRAPEVSGAELLEVPVPAQPGPAALPATCEGTATRKAADAEDLRDLAATIDPTAPALAQQKDDLGKQAVREDAEAAAYRGGCRTLVAVLVEADVARLRALLGEEGIRAVEPARAGAQLSELQVRAVPPEVTGVVPTASP